MKKKNSFNTDDGDKPALNNSCGEKNLKNQLKSSSFNSFKKNSINIVSLRSRYHLLDRSKLNETNINEKNLFERLKRGSAALVIDRDIKKGPKEIGLKSEIKMRNIIDNTLENLNKIESDNEKYVLVNKPKTMPKRLLADLSPIKKNSQSKLKVSTPNSNSIKFFSRKPTLSTSKYKEKYEKALQYGKLKKMSRKKLLHLSEFDSENYESISAQGHKYEDIEHIYFNDKLEIFKKYLVPKKKKNSFKNELYSQVLNTESVSHKTEINKNNFLKMYEDEPNEFLVKNRGYIPISKVIQDADYGFKEKSISRGCTDNLSSLLLDKLVKTPSNSKMFFKKPSRVVNKSNPPIKKNCSFISNNSNKNEANTSFMSPTAAPYKNLSHEKSKSFNNFRNNSYYQKLKILLNDKKENEKNKENKYKIFSNVLDFKKWRENNLLNTIQKNMDNLSNVNNEIDDVLSDAYREVYNQAYQKYDEKVNRIQEKKKKVPEILKKTFMNQSQRNNIILNIIKK